MHPASRSLENNLGESGAKGGGIPNHVASEDGTQVGGLVAYHSLSAEPSTGPSKIILLIIRYSWEPEVGTKKVLLVDTYTSHYK